VPPATTLPPAGTPVVYLLACGPDGHLYCGWTNRLAHRLGEHRAGRGAVMTRTRTPVTLAYVEVCASARDARRREAQIKKLTREQKLALIAASPPPPG
jgi:putative endonuclease